MKGSVGNPRAMMREAMIGVCLGLLACITFVADDLERRLKLVKCVFDDDNVCRRRKRGWMVRHSFYTAERWLTSIAM